MTHRRSGPFRTAGAALLALTLGAVSCAGPDAPHDEAAGGDAAPQDRFWAALTDLCGQAFEGRIAENSATNDTVFTGRRLVMHVRSCSEDEIRIPFVVGDDLSRTWVLTRTGEGLRLKHDHRHADGSEDEVTQYGGDTGSPGSAQKQEFPADAHTAELLPAAAANIWTVEIIPDQMYAYALRREGTDRRFRVEFDLRTPVEPPPPPWGSEATPR